MVRFTDQHLVVLVDMIQLARKVAREGTKPIPELDKYDEFLEEILSAIFATKHTQDALELHNAIALPPAPATATEVPAGEAPALPKADVGAGTSDPDAQTITPEMAECLEAAVQLAVLQNDQAVMAGGPELMPQSVLETATQCADLVTRFAALPSAFSADDAHWLRAVFADAREIAAGDRSNPNWREVVQRNQELERRLLDLLRQSGVNC